MHQIQNVENTHGMPSLAEQLSVDKITGSGSISEFATIQDNARYLDFILSKQKITTENAQSYFQRRSRPQNNSHFQKHAQT